MTYSTLFDYSFARPSIDTLKANHAVGVCRYLTRSSGAKRLGVMEASALLKAGLGIVLVFEDRADQIKGGAAQGRADAIEAAKQAKALGVPLTVPIFFAVDQDVPAAQALPYFQGVKAANIGHPIGVYGGINVVEGVVHAKLAVYVWQTAAWSAGKVSQMAHLFQHSDRSPVPGTDRNSLLKAFPYWGAPKPPAPKPVAKAAAKAPAKEPVKAAAKVPPKPVAKPASKPAVKTLTPAQRARAAFLHRCHLLHLATLLRRRRP